MNRLVGRRHLSLLFSPLDRAENGNVTCHAPISAHFLTDDSARRLNFNCFFEKSFCSRFISYIQTVLATTKQTCQNKRFFFNSLPSTCFCNWIGRVYFSVSGTRVSFIFGFPNLNRMSAWTDVLLSSPLSFVLIASRSVDRDGLEIGQKNDRNWVRIGCLDFFPSLQTKHYRSPW